MTARVAGVAGGRSSEGSGALGYLAASCDLSGEAAERLTFVGA